MFSPGPFISPFANPFPMPVIGSPQPATNHLPPVPQELNLPRALNYYADFSGCGFWRLIWPEHLLNANQRMILHGSTVMCYDPNYFRMCKTVRVQRQATPHQLRFIKFLREISDKVGFKIIYEIDDICFAEDIPEYNKFKPAFTDPSIRKTAQEIMEMCDEISVTCDFMKDYYSSKTSNKNVTVIPNFPPKWWMGRFYNEKRISESYDANIKKPRILYAGSGAHFDVENRVNQNDDFAHVLDVIAKTKDKYQWVFLGAYPLSLHPLVRNGTFEFHPWQTLYNYPEKIYNLNVNMMVAPLQDSIFNRAKSDLKYIEACCYGLPIACQDMVTYANAPFKFKTGDEMIDVVDDVLSKKGRYMNISSKARKVAEDRFLENENNIEMYYELYNYAYADPKRKLLNKLNNISSK